MPFRFQFGQKHDSDKLRHFIMQERGLDNIYNVAATRTPLEPCRARALYN